MHFLLTEDASGLLQSIIFERCYRRYGHVLYRTGAYLLEGRVEQDRRRGFSFLVDRIGDLSEALAGAAERARPLASSDALPQARGRGRRAG